jgi:hypothetical protein
VVSIVSCEQDPDIILNHLRILIIQPLIGVMHVPANSHAHARAIMHVPANSHAHARAIMHVPAHARVIQISKIMIEKLVAGVIHIMLVSAIGAMILIVPAFMHLPHGAVTQVLVPVGII